MEYPIGDLRIQLNEKIINKDKFLQLLNLVRQNPKLIIEAKKNN